MKRAKVLGICVGVSLLLLLAVLVGAVIGGGKLKKSVTIEAGNGELSASDFLRGEVQGMNIKPLTDLSQIDTHTPGDYVIQFLVNGKTQHTLLKIRDTLPPTAVVKDEVAVCVGDNITINDFVSEISDGTEVSAEFAAYDSGTEILNPGDSVGMHDIKISLTDSVGNTSAYSSVLIVCNVKSRVVMEMGDENFSALDFAKSKKDSVSFATDVSSYLTKPGEYPIDIIWNETKVGVVLKVEDTTAPQIYVGENREFFLGEPVLYRRDVFVTDNSGEEITLNINTDAVNPQIPGEYEVIYSATDPYGNKTELPVTITIKEQPAAKQEEVNALADAVLAEIGLSRYAQPSRDNLYKIFTWLRENIKYTGVSDKSSEVGAALAGYKDREGDCFTFYSVAASIFDRLGIDNMLILRDSESFHSWNLVKTDDTWYHFDACPYMAGETFEAFLVGDEELASFSKNYGKKYPDAAHKDYYKFKKDDYPERAK